MTKAPQKAELAQKRQRLLAEVDQWVHEIDEAIGETMSTQDDDAKAGPKDEAVSKELPEGSTLESTDSPQDKLPTIQARSLATPKKVREEIQRKSREVETK